MESTLSTIIKSLHPRTFKNPVSPVFNQGGYTEKKNDFVHFSIKAIDIIYFPLLL